MEVTFTPSLYDQGAERPDLVISVRGDPEDPSGFTAGISMVDALTGTAVTLSGSPVLGTVSPRDPGDGSTVYDYAITYPWAAGELASVASYRVTASLTSDGRDRRISRTMEVR